MGKGCSCNGYVANVSRVSPPEHRPLGAALVRARQLAAGASRQEPSGRGRSRNARSRH